MKKLLALILALVMVMGLATVGTNAALVKYSDADDITEYFDEAIDVMSAIGVLEGDGTNFRPTVQLKRSEAAKIVAYLNTNNKTAEGLIGTGKFSDVPTNHWAAGYIDYLTSISVIAGRSDTVFDPDGDLTAIDFAKMLLVVLGYDPQIEGLVGSDYQINTSKLATNAGLFKGLSDLKATDVLNREQAAQMAFNTIKGATVEYSNKGGNVSINGADISFGASNFNYVVTDLAKEQSISDRTLTNTDANSTNSGYTVEFGERQYQKLLLKKSNDDFGRPINVWTYDKDDIGKYVDKDTVIGEFTKAVTGADLVEMIGEAKIRNTDADKFNYYVNGQKIVYQPTILSTGNDATTGMNPFYNEKDPDTLMNQLAVGKENMIRSNKVAYGFTGNGVLTQVFERDGLFFITSILTYYVQANGDYNESNGKVSYDLYTADTANSSTNPGEPTGVVAPWFSKQSFVDNNRISSQDFPEIKDLKEDEGFLVRFFWNEGVNKYEVGEIELKPETKTEQTVTKFSKSNALQYASTTLGTNDLTAFYGGYLVSGSQYDYARTVYLDTLLRDYEDVDKSLKPTYDLVFDKYGYVIAAFQSEVEENYLFITGFDMSTSNLAAGTARAFAVFADGHTQAITVNFRDTNDNIDGTSGSGYDQSIAARWAAAKAGTSYVVGYDMINAYTGHAYNRWFTYSVEEGTSVYTLKPVRNSQIVSVANTATNENGVNPTDTTQLRFSAAHPKVVGNYINDYDTQVGVAGIRFSVDSAKFDTTSAWLNEDSVLITVEVGPTSARPATDLRAKYNYSIAKVSGVYTGIQNTVIDALPAMETLGVGASSTDYAASNPFGVFAWTVYDTKQNIKYAIVMGEASGNSDNYIYATSAATNERIEDGSYFWDFNALVDGEEKVLTIKTSYNSGKNLKTLLGRQRFEGDKAGNNGGNALFRVTYDKDGYVTNLNAIEVQTNEGAKVYNNFNKAAGDQIGNDVVVFNTYYTDTDILYTRGRTLNSRANGAGVGGAAGAGLTDVGLTVLDGAPIWVIQQEKSTSNGSVSKTIVKYTSLEKALGAVWASNTNAAATAADGNGPTTASQRNAIAGFNGYIAASLDQGQRAKWVIIKSLNVVNSTNTADKETDTGTATTYTLAQLRNGELNFDYATSTDTYVVTASFSAVTGLTLTIDEDDANDNGAYFTGTDIFVSIYQKTSSGRYVEVVKQTPLTGSTATVAGRAQVVPGTGSNKTNKIEQIRITIADLRNIGATLTTGEYFIVVQTVNPTTDNMVTYHLGPDNLTSAVVTVKIP